MNHPSPRFDAAMRPFPHDTLRSTSHPEALSGSDSLLRTLIHASPLAIYILDLQERVQLWNPAAERIFGWKEAEVLGGVNPTVPPEGRAEARALAEMVAAGEPVVEREVRRRRRDGAPIEVALSAARLCDARGRLQGIMAIAADITDRHRMEAERAELLERERVARADAEAAERRARFLAEGSALLDASLDYHTTLDNLARLAVPALADYCLIDELEGDTVSRVASAHADPERERLLYKGVRQPLDDDPEKHPVVRVLRFGASVLVPEVTETVLDALAHDEEHRERFRHIHLESFLVVPLMARGRTLGALTLAYAGSGRRYGPADLEMAEEVAHRAAVAIDTTRLYNEARQAVLARERMLAVVSHDLRNSLATVLLNTSAILETPRPLDPLERDQLQWIARSAEQMNRLISDLLDVSSIEAGRLSIEPAPYDTAALIQETAEMYRSLAAEKRIHYSWEVAEGTPWVLADGERVQQVLGNLLGNAIKFSPAQAAIVVRAEGVQEGVRFEVTDTGPGIAEEHLGSVFDLYWQGKRGRKMGAGLGLAIARAIVEAHGGAIWAVSRPGEGSTFYFTLPPA